MADIDHYHTKSNSITNNNNNNTTLKLFGFNISENGNNNNNNISVDDSRKSPSGYPESETETRKYECQYCFREFANSQALGGHQNAHKKERQLLKRAQIQASRSLANSYVPTSMFSTFSSFPPHLLPPGVVPVPHHQSPSWFYTSPGRQPFFSGHGSGLHESLGLHARTSPEEWNGIAREDGGTDRRDKGLGLDLHLSL